MARLDRRLAGSPARSRARQTRRAGRSAAARPHAAGRHLGGGPRNRRDAAAAAGAAAVCDRRRRDSLLKGGRSAVRAVTKERSFKAAARLILSVAKFVQQLEWPFYSCVTARCAVSHNTVRRSIL